jgi:hypothetical protein
MVFPRCARGWAAAGLLAGAWWGATAGAEAPAGLPPASLPAPVSAVPLTPATPPASSTPVSIPGRTAEIVLPPIRGQAGVGSSILTPAPPLAAPAPADGGEAPKGYWAAIPPIQALPPAGAFIVTPTGPGYYSARDCVEGNERPGPPKYPYPRFSIIPQSFFNIDWSYLDDPNNTEYDFFDFLKRIKFCDDKMMFTTGGEFRFRNAQEQNVRLTGIDNDNNLQRTRVYGDLWITNRFRIFGEFIEAQASGTNNLPPQIIDRNKADIQNLFVDVGLCDFLDSPVWARIGRQELLYGSQRLISPLDWANTRRTFQGIKFFWQNEQWSVDAFCVEPVIPRAGELDPSDHQQHFTGLWTTYRPVKGQYIDMYYLNLDHSGSTYPATDGSKGVGNISTFGSRYAGAAGNWLFDFEGMIQFGYLADRMLFAGAATVSGGYNFTGLPFDPQVFIGWDWASGDTNPGAGGAVSTFQQMFPFGHYYFGFIDDVGRQNIQDLNQQITLWPTRWIACQVQNHIFHLDSPKDALYGTNGAPLRQDKTGSLGTYVGDEVDFTVNFHLTKHQDVLIGYSKLYLGRFGMNAPQVVPLPNSNSVAQMRNGELFYIQYSYKW